MATGIETVATTTGTAQIRVYRTSQDGDRGWYWCWSETGTEWADRGNWSDATGPFPTRAEARADAVDIVATF